MMVLLLAGGLVSHMMTEKERYKKTNDLVIICKRSRFLAKLLY